MTQAINLYIKGGVASHHTTKSLEQLRDTIQKMQTMVIFTNQELSKITDVTSKFVIEKQAKVGSISPIEVTIPAGPTGLDSSQIELFHALKITTKVIKNQLEIMNPAKILVVGQKITTAEINIMKKFNIKPHKHQVDTKQILMNGNIYDSGILKITNDYMLNKLTTGIRNVAAFSVASNIPTRASAPHVISNAFRNILGLSLATGVDIPQTKMLSSSAPVVKEEPKKAEKPKEEKKKEPEPEPEEDVALGGMFDF